MQTVPTVKVQEHTNYNEDQAVEAFPQDYFRQE